MDESLCSYLCSNCRRTEPRSRGPGDHPGHTAVVESLCSYCRGGSSLQHMVYAVPVILEMYYMLCVMRCLALQLSLCQVPAFISLYTKGRGTEYLRQTCLSLSNMMHSAQVVWVASRRMDLTVPPHRTVTRFLKSTKRF